ncbi:GrpE-domain-containing protein [Sodiomyces alkalinus F11]|uniref:GrpE protein homolog n=1 Tax=Sodiomyces alkalinus (strain CBS 110278 / VKM F-3762 / F11) TaxID=1314773 RepID=A0A3N2Q932_SODAK|nr:GrpE-domain-containing protein [Sodiomyces alkalinus F11]ROT43274.1 GrpE-domain-containing protein [Sodiomyces alkalinus F11]
MLQRALVSGTRAARSAAKAPASQALLRSQFQTSPAFRIRAARVTPTVAARWYSAEGEAKDVKESEAAEKKEGNGTSELEALKKKLEAKEKEALDWKDKCLRSVADFRNLQDRTAREMKGARDFAIQAFAKDLVDSVDNLDRALSMVPEDKTKAAEDAHETAKDLAQLYEGLKMTEGILLNTLKKHGLERVDPTGDKFDPNEHEATFMTPQPDKDDGHVFFVQQKGFKLNGRVLRAAKVGVVKNK